MGAFMSRVFEHIPFEYAVCLSIGIIFLLVLIFRSESSGKSFWDIIRDLRPRERVGVYNKAEEQCRKVMQKLFGTSFANERPNFLKNPKTGRNLECDMINHNLKLVVEYNGAQHYHFTPYYHKTYQVYLDQVERDQFKHQKLRELGYDLIIVPYTITDFEPFLRSELAKIPRLASQMVA